MSCHVVRRHGQSRCVASCRVASCVECYESEYEHALPLSRLLVPLLATVRVDHHLQVAVLEASSCRLRIHYSSSRGSPSRKETDHTAWSTTSPSLEPRIHNSFSTVLFRVLLLTAVPALCFFGWLALMLKKSIINSRAPRARGLTSSTP